MTFGARRRPRRTGSARGSQWHRSPANQVRHDDLPLSARIADWVTAVFGSWGFILAQSALIILWLGYNGYVAVHYLHSREFDPYPFILLNLLFSTQAAYAAPLILLSQNRTAERDRVKAEHDFSVNVLALRALAELLGDVHDPSTQRDLLRQIDELLGADSVDPASLRGARRAADRRQRPAGHPPAGLLPGDRPGRAPVSAAVDHVGDDGDAQGDVEPIEVR